MTPYSPNDILQSFHRSLETLEKNKKDFDLAIKAAKEEVEKAQKELRELGRFQ